LRRKLVEKDAKGAFSLELVISAAVPLMQGRNLARNQTSAPFCELANHGPDQIPAFDSGGVQKNPLQGCCALHNGQEHQKFEKNNANHKQKSGSFESCPSYCAR